MTNVACKSCKSCKATTPSTALRKKLAKIAGKDVNICKDAFLSVHGISNDRLRRLRNHIVLQGRSTRDQRGKHANRPTKIPEPLVKVIEAQEIIPFP